MFSEMVQWSVRNQNAKLYILYYLNYVKCILSMHKKIWRKFLKVLPYLFLEGKSVKFYFLSL